MLHIKSDTFGSFTPSFLVNACATLIPPAGLFLLPWLERLSPTCLVSFLITVAKIQKKIKLTVSIRKEGLYCKPYRNFLQSKNK